MATIAEEWVREGERRGLQTGLQKGLQKGLEQGIPQGEALLLRRQLTRRFGVLPAWAETRLAAAGQGELEIWAVRVLDEPSLEAVFQG